MWIKNNQPINDNKPVSDSYMSPIEKRQSSGRPHKDDDVNRQRLILDTAVQLYAKNGFEKVTFKGISAEAGVATSLIRHYFGSKEDFRATCSDYVISEVRVVFNNLKPTENQVLGPDYLDSLGEGLIQQVRGRIHLLRYLARLFLLGDRKANQLFNEYYQMIKQITDQFDAAGMLHEKGSSVWVSFHFIFNQLGPVFLMDQISEQIAQDAYQQDVSKARTSTLVHIAKEGIFK